MTTPEVGIGHYSPALRHWTLDDTIAYLNHGAFGACPRAVLDDQQQWRERMEREPVWFLDHELEPLLDGVREQLGAFLGASPDLLAFVPNATYGVNSVLRSLRFEAGDELMVTDHEYNATANAARYVAAQHGARVVTARIPFPIVSEQAAVDAVLDSVTPRTRLLVISHVTSPTALVLPVGAIVAELAARGIDTLVDGAHAAGMVPLDIDALGAAYYTGNCHKWLCAPKGAAFLHVRSDRIDRVRPLAISHGANSARSGRSRYRLEFDWTGTGDPTPFLSVPAAISAVGSFLDGGWRAIEARNRALALDARDLLCAALRVAPPAPDTMIGSIASVPLPDRLHDSAPPMPPVPADPDASLPEDPLHDYLFGERRIEVPIMGWPIVGASGTPRHRLLRVSAQLYNDRSQYEALAAVLLELVLEAD